MFRPATKVEGRQLHTLPLILGRGVEGALEDGEGRTLWQLVRHYNASLWRRATSRALVALALLAATGGLLYGAWGIQHVFQVKRAAAAAAAAAR